MSTTLDSDRTLVATWDRDGMPNDDDTRLAAVALCHRILQDRDQAWAIIDQLVAARDLPSEPHDLAARLRGLADALTVVGFGDHPAADQTVPHCPDRFAAAADVGTAAAAVEAVLDLHAPMPDGPRSVCKTCLRRARPWEPSLSGYEHPDWPCPTAALLYGTDAPTPTPTATRT